jgi:tetratricopeptide (TPR) repeat protein
MEKINTGWYNIDLFDTDVALKFYKKHKLYYDNLNKAIDKTTIEEFIIVKQRYCEALEKMNRYNDALIILEQVYKLLDRLKNKSSKYYNSLYEKTLFCEGRLLGSQEKYNESNKIFEKLIGIDPKNERYENWYLTNKEWLLSKKIKPIEYIILAAFGFVIIFGNKSFNTNILIVKIIVFALFIGLFIFKRTYRKLIKTPKPEIKQK